MSTHTCNLCSKQYKSYKKSPKFCSRECVNKAQKKCNDPICKQCNKVFRWKGNTTNTFCSISCSKENRTEAKEHRAIYGKLRTNIYFPECIICHRLFTTNSAQAKYCSKECLRELARNKSKESIRNKTKTCRVCSRQYQNTNAIKGNSCSDECRLKAKREVRRERKHRRRLKEKNNYQEGTTLLNIKKRDGDRCLICNKKVLDKNISGYDKLNGTIGHIISIANGGSHTMSNVQLECQQCNTSKGARNSGQLRLW